MTAHKTTIQMKKLKSLISSGLQALPKDRYHKQAVVIIGDTGVGKSTLLTALSGSKMIAKFDGIRVTLHSQKPGKTKIGHTKLSQTFIPMKVMVDGITFFDCPGFNDNKGQEYEIANSFFLQKLLDNYNKVKIVIMIEQIHISQVRADRFPKLLHNLFAFFGNLQDMMNGCCIIINRSDPSNTKDQYIEEINRIISNKNTTLSFFNEQELKLLKFIADNERIFLFRQPQKRFQEYVYQMGEQQRQILPGIRLLSSVKSRHINLNCSGQCKLEVRKLIDEITMKCKNKLKNLFSNFIHKTIQDILLHQKDIDVLIEKKQKLQQIRNIIKNNQNRNILKILDQIQNSKQSKQIEQDAAVIEFFKQIYDKQTYFYQSICSTLTQQSNNTFAKIQAKLTKVTNELIQQMKQKKVQTNLKIELEEQAYKKLKDNSRKIQQLKKKELEDEVSNIERQYVNKVLSYAQQSQESVSKIDEKQQKLKLRDEQKIKDAIKFVQTRKQLQQNLMKQTIQAQQAKNQLIKKQAIRKNKYMEQNLRNTIERAQQIKKKQEMKVIPLQWTQDLQSKYNQIKQAKTSQIKSVQQQNKIAYNSQDIIQNNKIQCTNQPCSQILIEEQAQGLLQKQEQQKLNKQISMNIQKSFSQKKKQMLEESLKIQQELSIYIENIKKKRKQQLEEANKNVQKSIQESRCITNKQKSEIKSPTTNASFTGSPQNYLKKLSFDTPNEESKRLNFVGPSSVSRKLKFNLQSSNSILSKERQFNSIKKQFESKSHKQLLQPLNFISFNTKQSRPKVQSKFSDRPLKATQNITRDTLASINYASNIYERTAQKCETPDYTKSVYLAKQISETKVITNSDKKISIYSEKKSPLVNQINEVLQSLNNISGDLQRVKGLASQICNKKSCRNHSDQILLQQI